MKMHLFIHFTTYPVDFLLNFSDVTDYVEDFYSNFSAAIIRIMLYGEYL